MTDISPLLCFGILLRLHAEEVGRLLRNIGCGFRFSPFALLDCFFTASLLYTEDAYLAFSRDLPRWSNVSALTRSYLRLKKFESKNQ